ncbi:MAG: NADAR family protein [Lachnospiraceae bacterium]|nr:NADAR family protein [Lachnospiraceae bacterium]
MDYLKDFADQKYTVYMIRDDYLAGKKQNYHFFWGHKPSEDGSITKSCLSQWWHCEFEINGQKYSCMEQFMMASKARLFQDDDILKNILHTSDPYTIKELGRKVKGFREDLWNNHKFSIVFYGNYQKFSQNQELKEYLIATKDSILAEASPYDAIWGIKMSENDVDAENPMKWRGQNLLGFALMQVRDCLMEDFM